MSERLMQEFRERAERPDPPAGPRRAAATGAARRRVRPPPGRPYWRPRWPSGASWSPRRSMTKTPSAPHRSARHGSTRHRRPPPVTASCWNPKTVGGSHPCLRGVSSQRGSTCGGRSTSIRGPISSPVLNTDLAPARSGDLEAHFVVPGDYWYWWGGGAGKANPAGPRVLALPADRNHPDYRSARAEVPGVRARPCAGRPGVRFVRRPDSRRIARRRGVRGPEQRAEVRLRRGPRAVHSDRAVSRRPGVLGAEHAVAGVRNRDEIDAEDDTPVPDGDIYTSAGHVLDVWVVDVKGEHVVVSADTAHTNAADLSEMRELLDSIRFEFTEAVVPRGRQRASGFRRILSNRGVGSAGGLSRRVLTRLATAVSAMVPKMTTSESQMGISGAHGTGSPPLMNGSSLVQGLQDQLDADESEDDG